MQYSTTIRDFIGIDNKNSIKYFVIGDHEIKYHVLPKEFPNYENIPKRILDKIITGFSFIENNEGKIDGIKFDVRFTDEDIETVCELLNKAKAKYEVGFVKIGYGTYEIEHVPKDLLYEKVETFYIVPGRYIAILLAKKEK